jgi:hypothetical protein
LQFFTTRERKNMHRNMIATKWLDKMADFNIEIGTMNALLRDGTCSEPTIRPVAGATK